MERARQVSDLVLVLRHRASDGAADPHARPVHGRRPPAACRPRGTSTCTASAPGSRHASTANDWWYGSDWSIVGRVPALAHDDGRIRRLRGAEIPQRPWTSSSACSSAPASSAPRPGKTPLEPTCSAPWPVRYSLASSLRHRRASGPSHAVLSWKLHRRSLRSLGATSTKGAALVAARPEQRVGVRFRAPISYALGHQRKSTTEKDTTDDREEDSGWLARWSRWSP